MRRPLLAALAILLIAAGYTLLSQQFGKMAEDAIREQTGALSRLGIDAEIAAYERGLFKSRITLETDLSEFVLRNAPTASEELVEGVRALPLEIALRHGPLLFARSGLFGLAAIETDLARAGGHMPGGEDIDIAIPLSVRITADGIDGRMSIGAFDLDSRDADIRLAIDGISLDFAAGGDSRSFSGRWRSGDLRLASPALAFAMGPTTLDVDMSLAGTRTWIGSQTGEIVSMRIDAAAGEVFRSGDIRFESRAGREDDPALLGGDSRLAVTDMTITTAGRPPFTVGMAMASDFAHFPIAAMEGFQAAIEDLAAAGDTPDEAAAGAFLEALVAAANEAAAYRPRIGITDISFTHADGAARMALDLGLKEGAEFSPDTLQNALGVVVGTGSIILDHGLLRAVARTYMAPDPADAAAVGNAFGMLLMQLTASGMFRAEGETIVSDLAFADGILSANGMPVYDAGAAFRDTGEN